MYIVHYNSRELLHAENQVVGEMHKDKFKGILHAHMYIYCAYIAYLCKKNIFVMGKMFGMHFAS